jgi:gamma-glutamyltranspeptidase/glutathione hydrolase
MLIKKFSFGVVFLLTLYASLLTASELPRAAVTADGRAAVATVNPIATEAGLQVLAKGGNAIDAAIAAAAMLGVVDGYNSGIGGGCFALVHLANGKIIALDGREMAPKAATRTMYFRNGKADPSLSQTGALAVAVPGSVEVYSQLSERGGKLPWADLWLPAAERAEQGFVLSANYAQRLKTAAPKMRDFSATAAIFLDEKNQPWPAGHLLKQTDLANTYRQLANKNSAYFYYGAFPQQIADWMKTHGGIITAADFANYVTVQREPLHTTYRGLDIYGFPPPSSGGVHVAEILNMLENSDIAKLPPADRQHVLAEAMKLAFADRAFWLGDADFVNVPKALISKTYAQKRFQTINVKTASASVTQGQPLDISTELFGKHTTHIATADDQGNWVAITTTINTTFGSKVIVPNTGVLLNNQMDDFSIQPGVANAYGLVGAEANSIAPGKRPLSSMSPTIVLENGRPIMTVGAAGGPTIITQVVQALINHLALDMPLPEALAAPRIHQQWRPDQLLVEKSLPEVVKVDLQSRGHVIKSMPMMGATQAIALDKRGHFVAVSEPRLTNNTR